MREEDAPPARIWLNNEALNLHFERVKERYKSGNPATEDSDPGDFDQNELTRDLRRR